MGYGGLFDVDNDSYYHTRHGADKRNPGGRAPLPVQERVLVQRRWRARRSATASALAMRDRCFTAST